MIYIFHHTDLDGMGVKIVGMYWAMSQNEHFKTIRCNYNDVNQKILDEVVDIDPINGDKILIGDISCNEEVAKKLDHFNKTGIPVILRDHHATAEWLNKYDWAEVHEKIDGIERCGTWQMAAVFPEIVEKLSLFIDKVDMWDTWKWKAANDIEAKDLNALFQILGEEDFTKYMQEIIKDCDRTSEQYLFSDYGRTMIEAHNRIVRKNADSYMRSIHVMNLQVGRKPETYKTGVVFVNHDLSEVADIILQENPELDILMMVGWPKNISYRTQKHLNISLGDLAKLVTGSGGGHPMSAGSTISEKQFCDCFLKDLYRMSGHNRKLSFSELKRLEKE